MFRSDVVLNAGFDIYAICESHLKDNNELNVNGYKWFGNNRVNLDPNAIRGSGGVGFLVSDDTLSKFEANTIDDRYEGILWIRLDSKCDDTLSVVLCVCYLPPEGSSRGNSAQEFYDNLLGQVYMYYDGSPLYLLGDYNGRIGNKKDFNTAIESLPTRSVIDNNTNKYGEYLIDFLIDAKCCVVNGRGDTQCDNFTSILSSKGRSVVDYILAPYSQLNDITDFKVITMTECIDVYSVPMSARAKLPDHSLVTCTVNLSPYCSLRPAQVAGSRGIRRHCPPQDKRMHRRYDLKLLPEDLLQSEQCRRCINTIISNIENRIESQNDIDGIYDQFIEIVHTELEANVTFKDYTPHMKSKRKHQKPYWNSKLKDMWVMARDKERKYLNFRGLTTVKNKLRTEFDEARKTFDKELRRAERLYNSQQRDKIHQLRTDNPKQFWSVINKLGPVVHKDEQNAVRTEDGSISFDHQVIMKKWKDDFEVLYQMSNSTGEEETAFLAHVERQTAEWQAEYDAVAAGHHITIDDELRGEMFLASRQLNSPITLQETINALRNLKNGKAVGVDNIANELLKLPALQSMLHKLFSACFDSNIIPSQWTKAIIHPILKKGKDSLIPLNHRGISLISTVAKTFSSIINKRLVDFLESHDIFVEEQNGFRRLRSCLDHIYSLTTVIRNRKIQKLQTFCALVDFEKAFDSIQYRLLWSKLSACCVHGKMYSVIRTMYQNLQCSVRVGGALTDWFSQTAGVRQGDTLAPTLFAIYINDLVPEINSLNKGIRISDELTLSILLYADDIVLMSETADGLQSMLDALQSWSKNWKLRINRDKTKIVHFRKPRDTITTHDFLYEGSVLDKVSQYRYLGLDLHDTLDFSDSVKVLSKSASRALGAVTSKFYALNGLDYYTYTKMFDAMVSPILDYGSEIWGAKKRDCCDVVQHRAMRTFLGVGKCTPLPMMYSELAWNPSIVRHQLSVVKFWIRLTRKPHSSLIRQVFNWDYALARQNRGTWCLDVKKILTKCGMNDLFGLQSGDINLHRIKQTLLENETSRMANDMISMSRLRCLSQMADFNLIEPALYVTLALTRDQRSALAKLRSGTLRIALETGRYRQIPPSERVCKQCDLNTVEDEEHFLFNCPANSNSRTLLNNSDNFNILFQNANILRRTANYIIAAMKNRK